MSRPFCQHLFIGILLIGGGCGGDAATTDARVGDASLTGERSLPHGDGLPPPGQEAGPRPDGPVVTTTCAGDPPASQTMVTGTQVYPIPEIAPPAKCQAIADPAFHTTVARITDKATDGYPGPGIENEYARADPENADGSLLVLRGNDGCWQLYDARSFQRLRALQEIFLGGQEPEPRWDPQDPQRLYHLANMKLMAADLTTKQSTVVHDFKADFPTGATISTEVEGDASADRDSWCLLVKNGSGKFLAVVVYDKKTDAIVGTLKTFPSDIDWVSMSMSGQHCVIGWVSPGPKAYSRDLQTSVSLPAGSAAHADLARTADGQDVLVYQNAKTDRIAMAALDTGAEIALVDIPFNVNTDINLHVSGNAALRPGWALISTYGAKNPPAGKSHSWMDLQLFFVELVASPRIWRVASTRSYTSINAGGQKNYFAEAYAAVNSRGTRVYWGSNWGSAALEHIEGYVALLPQAWPTLLP